MPRLISRQEALERIVAEGGHPACLMCAILAGSVGATYPIHETARVVVLLPRYVRRWGQIQVVPRAHATRFADVDTGTWAETNALALHAARVLERVLAARRCYLASTGSAAGRDLVQTSEHLHAHVVPIYEPDDRPGEVFSWASGVFVAEPDEWESLRASLKGAW